MQTIFHLNPTAKNTAALDAMLMNPTKVDQSKWLKDYGQEIAAGNAEMMTSTLILIGPALTDLVITKDGNGCQFSYEIGDLMGTFVFFKTPVFEVMKRVRNGRLAFKMKRLMQPVTGISGEVFRPIAATLI